MLIFLHFGCGLPSMLSLRMREEIVVQQWGKGRDCPVLSLTAALEERNFLVKYGSRL